MELLIKYVYPHADKHINSSFCNGNFGPLGKLVTKIPVENGPRLKFP